MNEELPSDILWTRHDCARYLNVHVNTVDNLRKRGELPFLFVGRSVRFDPDEVRTWFERKNAKVPFAAVIDGQTLTVSQWMSNFTSGTYVIIQAV